MSVHASNRPYSARPARILLYAALVAAMLALAASTGSAGGFLSPGTKDETANDKPTWAVPAARMPVEGEGTAAVEAELHNAEQRVREAIQNAETAAYQLKRARTRNYPRGEALEELKVQAQDTRRERSAAADDFSTLVERARREGVPMGTLSPYMDLDDRLRGERSSWKSEK